MGRRRKFNGYFSRRASKQNIIKAREAMARRREQIKNGTLNHFNFRNESMEFEPEDDQLSCVDETEMELNVTEEDDETEIKFEVEEEIKQEISDIELELEVDELSDPLNANESTGVLNDCTRRVYKCLICFREDPDPRPLTGILPRARRLKNPEQVEDDLRIIYLLKLMFQWTTVEPNYLMERSNGQSPREWFHLCQSCRPLVIEIQTLKDRIRDCREKIRNEILNSTSSTMSPFSKNKKTMTIEIRNRVAQQVRWRSMGASNPNVFNDGDREAASRLINSNMQTVSGPNESISIGNSMQMVALSGRPCSKKVRNEELFTCPYFCSENANVSSSSNKMNSKELYYHLIFHSDYPMNCSECGVFLPRDSSTLEAHWQQYHSNKESVPGKRRFFEQQVYIDLPGNEPPPINITSSKKHVHIECTDCVTDSKISFSSMSNFKTHQALRHPEIARVSCPLCFEIFTDEGNNDRDKRNEIVRKHLKDVHKTSMQRGFWKSCPCKFCGKWIPEFPHSTGWKESLLKIEKLHMLSKHGDLIKASFTCTQCSQEYLSLEEFQEHATATRSGNIHHSEINWRTGAVQLFSLVTSNILGSVTCGLCEGSNATKLFQTIKSFLCHLTVSHSLYFKWKYDLLNPSNLEVTEWKSVGTHIEDMKNFQSFLDKQSGCEESQPPPSPHVEETEHSDSIIPEALEICDMPPEQQTIDIMSRTTYLKKRPPIYHCPSCPQLNRMNLDEFIVHLIFHWRHPNKCTVCKVYLPISSGVIEDHWKQQHAELDSSTTVKCESVNHSPGNIFRCQKCPEKFMSFRERNNHETNAHDSNSSTQKKTCSVCNTGFKNTKEVRLHKALDHPEIASLSCYYCEDQFTMETLLGSNCLDLDALEQHIREKQDHPKDGVETIRHLTACNFCGLVMMDSYLAGNRVRSHIFEAHGAAASKTPFTCFICNKGVSSLKKHLKINHTKSCVCETCGEEVRPRTLPYHNLVKHDILMKGYKKYSCKEVGCDYKTIYLKNFIHHNVSHNKGRPRSHKCSICDKAFFTSHHRKRHEERHKNKDTKPHQCELCGSSFAVMNDLYIHKRLSHLNRKFPSTNQKRKKKNIVEMAKTL